MPVSKGSGAGNITKYPTALLVYGVKIRGMALVLFFVIPPFFLLYLFLVVIKLVGITNAGITIFLNSITK